MASRIVVVAMLVMAAGPVMTAQDSKPKPYPMFTADHFVAAMKTAGQAFTAVNNSLSGNEIEDAKAYLAISRDRLATTITFWRDRRKDDAIKMLRETVAILDALDAALSTTQVDRTVTAGLIRQTGAACQACHAAYRDQDPVTKAYRFKTGVQ